MSRYSWTHPKPNSERTQTNHRCPKARFRFTICCIISKSQRVKWCVTVVDNRASRVFLSSFGQQTIFLLLNHCRPTWLLNHQFYRLRWRCYCVVKHAVSSLSLLTSSFAVTCKSEYCCTSGPVSLCARNWTSKLARPINTADVAEWCTRKLHTSETFCCILRRDPSSFINPVT